MNSSPAELLEKLRFLVRSGLVREALLLLNAQGGHRFTALYRFQGDTLHNALLVDRDNPEVQSSPDIPVLASYCAFVRQSDRTFTTPDAPNDARVEGHPKRHVVQSYCGVPLVDEAGRAFGTICVFDFAAIPIPRGMVDLMEAIAPLLDDAKIADTEARRGH